MWKYERACMSRLLKQVNVSIKDREFVLVRRHRRHSCLFVFFRNGEQIDFLALNEKYNFDFQQVTNLGKTKTVKTVGFTHNCLKSDTNVRKCLNTRNLLNKDHVSFLLQGDKILVECTYETNNRTGITWVRFFFFI